ncbi:protein tyrosine phosphatase family protein [Luteimonas sp. 8-5]|uniref:protein tyrosine phosphatase family protein n=1 Tax=Luteimonas sp. 8-5 TaxID=3039387 RepID=UPI0024366384|nr:protein tyrosine phosphatase family protein [Luteimonas sp. 8-5]MDG6347622.1 protein tyrosine phosphatase family protein [Luteimonas sp. 8-5]
MTIGTIAACLFALAVHAGDPAGLDLMNAANPGGGIYTSGRISQGDIAKLEAAGIRHVIDLAQDGETPEFDEAAAMQAAGIGYDNLPISGPDALTRANVEAFDRLLAGAQAPVLVHCASGNRVGAMAALRAAWIEGVPVEEAIATGRAWGLRSLEAAVRERLAASPGVAPVSSK